MSFDPFTLATGGLVAAVVAFWSQFKNFLRYLSSIFVIQLYLDPVLSEAVVMYLKANFKKAPSGLLHYQQLYLTLRSKLSTNVPFRTIGPTNLFYKGKSFIVLNLTSVNANVLSIRGLIDPDQFIINALEFRNKYYNEAPPVSFDDIPRYQVYKVVGEEKGAWATTVHHRLRNSSSAQSSSPPNPADTSSLAAPNYNLDPPLNYSKEDIVFTSRDDPFEGLFYDPEIQKRIEDALHWKAQRAWYQDRSIPWKRGWMIYGPPGTGKSSLAKVLARSLNFPIYHFMLSTLSDQEFMENWSTMNTPCVALFEDFDTVFDKRTPLTEHKSLTFDCVLNQLSGISALNGVFLVVTTNDLSKIDPAMGVASEHGTISTRPGRVDQLVYLGPTSEQVRLKMAAHILRDWPESHKALVDAGQGTTPVQFQEMCIQYAIERMHKDSH